MPATPVKIDTISRLNRNLGLMQAGSIVTIDISTPAGQKAKFRTTFIGYLPKQYVLIQFPEQTKIGRYANFIVQGTAITVRGLIEGHEGSVAAFVSTVKQTLQIPSRIIVLDFPRTVSVQSLRKTKRIDTEITAKVKIQDAFWHAVISDVSLTGCQLIIIDGGNLVIEQEAKIDIVIEDFLDLKNLNLKGEVCSNKLLHDGISLGIKFLPEMKENVSKLLHHIITEED